MVRSEFPNFAERSEYKFELPTGLQAQVPAEILRQVVQASGNKNYEFMSEDKVWTINLTRTFVALSTGTYTRWEDFKRKLTIPFAALLEVYSPQYFSRIGLRYVDVIKRSELGLEGVGWNDLLQPYISGFLAADEVKDHIQNFQSRYEIQLEDDKSVVRILTKFVEAKDEGHISYMIDSDFSRPGRTDVNQALSTLDYFNVRASRLIQWCITETLHHAMEPEEI
jgi:uncharacterized protein (TIGR04255 family)